MDKTKIYSPTQVAAGAFIGGPFAGVYFLASNFVALRNDKAFRSVLMLGGLLIVLMFIVLPFLPAAFPNYAIPIAYVVAARVIAEKYQLTKQAVRTSEVYTFQGSGKVFAISVGFLAAFVVLFMGWIFGLAQLGIVKV